MKGYAGKVLIVDLTDQSYEVRDLDPSWARDFLGGASLGARYLYDLMPPHTHPFAPESVVGFVCGTVNNTTALMSARYSVVCKSPVTMGWSDSNSGGDFGPKLRKAGYDAVFVKGISEKPVYLYLNDGEVSFRDAANVWGKTTSEADAIIKEEVGAKDVGMAVIGQGGEHLSYMAAVMCDLYRAAGRGGPGAVMGSKKLKAVVARGTHTIEAADQPGVLAANKMAIEHGKGPGAVPVGKFRATGTTSDYDSSVYHADAGIKNWTGAPEDLTDEMIDNLCGRVMDPIYKVKQHGCLSCHIKCSAIYKVDTEKHHIEVTGRPEYESLGAFGSMLLNGDSDLTLACNWLCNEYGYDTLSFGGTLAWLMECHEKGIFTTEELDGIDLKWGDHDSIWAMAQKICNYEGIGIPLNLASKGAADYFGKGHECLAVANGIEVPMHGSRYNPGLAREYKFDPAPGRHTRGGLKVPYGHQPPEVKYNYEDTGRRDVEGLYEWELCNCGGFCSFGNFLISQPVIHAHIVAVTGFEEFGTEEGRIKYAQRGFTMRTAFNIREGITRKDLYMSDRCIGRPPLERGPLKDVTVDVDKLGDNFFEAMGWYVDTGIPKKETLESLGGLECVIKDLYPEG